MRSLNQNYQAPPLVRRAPQYTKDKEQPWKTPLTTNGRSKPSQTAQDVLSSLLTISVLEASLKVDLSTFLTQMSIYT